MKTVTVMIIMGRERDRWGYPGRYGEEEEGEGEEEEGLVWEYSSSWMVMMIILMQLMIQMTKQHTNTMTFE